MMSDSTKLKMAQRMQNSSPVGSAHGSLISAPTWFYPNLHIKGFAGGVPINTETAAVKPRVGCE